MAPLFFHFRGGNGRRCDGVSRLLLFDPSYLMERGGAWRKGKRRKEPLLPPWHLPKEWGVFTMCGTFSLGRREHYLFGENGPATRSLIFERKRGHTHGGKFGFNCPVSRLTSFVFLYICAQLQYVCCMHG